MKPLATLVIRPLNVTPAAEQELSVAIPAGTYIIAMMDMARMAYERLRTLQREAEAKDGFAKDEHEQYEPSPYDGTYSEE